MTEQLSNCCKAKFTASNSDNGLAVFVVCSACKRACDLYETDKQVIFKNEYEVSMPIEEWQRLKRIEENVKVKYNEYLQKSRDCVGTSIYNKYDEILRILVSLDE